MKVEWFRVHLCMLWQGCCLSPSFNLFFLIPFKPSGVFPVRDISHLMCEEDQEKNDAECTRKAEIRQAGSLAMRGAGSKLYYDLCRAFTVKTSDTYLDSPNNDKGYSFLHPWYPTARRLGADAVSVWAGHIRRPARSRHDTVWGFHVVWIGRCAAVPTTAPTAASYLTTWTRAGGHGSSYVILVSPMFRPQ